MAVIPLVATHPDSYLFDRSRGAHPWFAALGALQGSGGAGHAALAQNWRMDGRVDALREVALAASGCFSDGSLGLGFESAIGHYQGEHRRDPRGTPAPGYLASANQGNRIPRDQLPGRKQRLVHFASLNRLLGFANSEHRGDLEYVINSHTAMDLPTRPGHAYLDKLVSALQAQGQPAIQEFAQSLSLALGEGEPHWWATFAHEIGDLEKSRDWTQAARKIGQGYFSPGDWLIAWRYSAEQAGALYRPTVAEAGNSAFHFPAHDTLRYGVAMPLAESLPAVREVVHAPLKGQGCGAACIGFGQVLQEPVAAPDGATFNAWLGERRRRHGAMLARQSGATAQWLSRHGVAP